MGVCTFGSLGYRLAVLGALLHDCAQGHGGRATCLGEVIVDAGMEGPGSTRLHNELRWNYEIMKSFLDSRWDRHHGQHPRNYNGKLTCFATAYIGQAMRCQPEKGSDC